MTNLKKTQRILRIGCTAWLAFICGCGGSSSKNSSSTPDYSKAMAEKELGFGFGGLGVLTKATIDNRLPYVISSDRDGINTGCFEQSVDLGTKDINGAQVVEQFQSRSGPIDKAVMRWFYENLMPQGVDPKLIEGWKIKFEAPVVTYAPISGLRLAPQQTCISDKFRSFVKNTRIVTALFGAKVFHFKSPKPIDRALLDALKNAAAQRYILLEHQELFYPAVDDKGNVAVNQAGERMFVTPAGSIVPERQIPPPERRPIIQIRLTFNNGPLYFAYGDLPKKAWMKESDEQKCNLPLVFDDATPRLPDCAKFKHAGFGISRGLSSDGVLVKVAAADATASQSVAFGATQMIQVGGRVVVWVKPRPLEEGAFLAVDSLVLGSSDETPEIPKIFAKTKK